MPVRTPRTETIRWSLHDCSLGRSLIAGSEKGLCALLLGDDEEMLGKELRRRFRRAQLAPAEHEDARLADAVLAQIDAPGSPIDFPLDLRGSPFQKRVWAALRGIPLGKTASYAEIARAIGAPAATRAVAGACAANPIAVFIPCHRVLRSDGALSGYRWGVERKRELLAREGVQID
jgi:AraC family transcriptional regulator of adaptative response/methylated-DNA-[protein]-cysteine methyltransferase